MGLIGAILRKIIRLILYLAVVVVFIIVIPNLPPYTKFSRIELEPTLPRVGALSPNSILSNAEPLYKDKLLGPEAFQIWNGEVYTGLLTGEIVKLSPGGHVTFVAKIGQPCTGLVQEHICGRPLGFVIDEKKKLLYVADAYYGIWKVNLVNNRKQLLVSPQVEINGKAPKLFNAVALDVNGDLYWTDSSSDFHLRDGVMAVLADPSGRLLHYNSAKNSSEVLLENLWFANGLVVSPDNQFIVVAETIRYRLVKYYINGPRKGSSEVFVAGLPGAPDNVRTLPDGSGILVSLYSVFDEEDPMLMKSMANAPLARKFLARLMRLIEIPCEYLHSLFPNYIFETIVHTIGHFGSVTSFNPIKTGVLQLDWNGNIIASYYNTDKSVHHISDVVVFNNKLFLGTPQAQNFIGAVPAPPQLIKAFTTKKTPIKEQPKETLKTPEINKPNVDEKKEVPKKAKPDNKPLRQTTPPPTTITKAPNDITKEKVAEQNAIPKEVKPKEKINDSKPKDSPKVADVKQKEQNIKPNVQVKQTEPKSETIDVKDQAQTKAAPKQEEKAKGTESKSKVDVKTSDTKPEVASQAAGKPKIAQKDPPPKVDMKKPDTKPEVSSQTTAKPKTVQKEAAPKVKIAPQKAAEPKLSTAEKTVEPQEKPVKQTDKVKIPNNDNVKAKTENKNSQHSNTATDKPAAKTTSKPTVTKSESQTKTKPTTDFEVKTPKVVTESSQKEYKRATVTKPIPVEEDIPSDTAKPNKETLKVIKKSGPQEIRNPNL